MSWQFAQVARSNRPRAFHKGPLRELNPGVRGVKKAVAIEVKFREVPHRGDGAGLSRFRARSPLLVSHGSCCQLPRGDLPRNKRFNAGDGDPSASPDLECLKLPAGDQFPALGLADSDHCETVFWRDGERLDCGRGLHVNSLAPRLMGTVKDCRGGWHIVADNRRQLPKMLLSARPNPKFFN